MSEVIKFPYQHSEELNHAKMHEMIDEVDYPSKFTGFFIAITCEDGVILTCFDQTKALENIGALEILKRDIIQNMC